MQELGNEITSTLAYFINDVSQKGDLFIIVMCKPIIT